MSKRAWSKALFEEWKARAEDCIGESFTKTQMIHLWSSWKVVVEPELSNRKEAP